MAKKTTKNDIDAVAQKVRSPLSSFRMLSGEFRADIANALGQLQEVSSERESMTTDRKRIQLLLQKSQETFSSSEDNLNELRSQLGAEIECLTRLSASIEDLHQRNLDLKPRLAKLDNDETKLRDREAALSAAQAANATLLAQVEEGLGTASRTENQALDLLGEVREDLATIRKTLEEVTSERDAIADKLVRIKSRTAQAELLEQEVDRREAEVAALTAAVASREAAVQAEAERVQKKDDEATARQVELLELQNKMTGLYDRAVAQEEKLNDHQESLAGRERRLEAGETELKARNEKQREERNELDQKIQLLANLEERNEELLMMRSILDSERKEQDARAAANEATSGRLLSLEEELSATLVRVEATARDTQEINDQVRAMRELQIEEHQSRMATLDRREASLSAREKAISVWKLQAELRERKIQQGFDELTEIEGKKHGVRQQIAELEKEHAKRIAATEVELREERKKLSHDRDEAAKARDLYIRNKQQVDAYVVKLDKEKAEHEERAQILKKREMDLDQRGKEVKALEAQVAALREQQMELHRTISSLTTDLGARVSPAGEHAAKTAKGN